MKLTTIIITAFLFQVSANTLAQKITLSQSNVALNHVFKELQGQCGYNFVYTSQMLEGIKPVNIKLKNATLQQALDALFENQPVTYVIKENTVVVQRRNNPDQPQLTIEIKGKVVDERGQEFPGVSVKLKGTRVTVATDNSGQFKITVPDNNAVLVFSYVGYNPIEETVKQRTTINVKMVPAESALNDVVITGYQSLNKKTLTASITTIQLKDLETVYQPNIDKLLQGQVPGLTVMSTSGAPGAVPQIRIRGTSTISGNVQPLWVVDGIILDDAVNASVDDILTNRNLIASGIGGINVDDIESISVLKDAAATAIYGTKAANGVIVITSKKGVSGKTRINYNSGFSLAERPRIEDAYMMNSKERIDVNIEMISKGILNASSPKAGDYGTVSDFERYFIDVNDRKISWSDFQSKVNGLEEVNTDWFKYLFRNAFTQRHSLNISGGNERTTFYASGSYLNDQATAKGVGQKTYTGSLKVNTRFGNNIRLGLSLDVNARDNTSFFATDSRENPYEWAIYTTRAQHAFDENGDYSHLYYNSLKYNFLENREQSWRNSRNFGMRGNVDFEWKLLKDLTYSSLFSYTKQNTTDIDIATEDSYFVRARKKDVYQIVNSVGIPLWLDGGYRQDKNSYNGSITFRNQLTYNPVFNHVHYLNVMAGQEIRTSKFEDQITKVYGYAHDRGHQQVPQFDLMRSLGLPYWTENLNETAAVSYFGVASYTYDNRYSISLNARTDGSNRFGLKTNQLFQPLWAVGLNYQLKEESFLRDKDWLSYLTLRGSYGSQGNVASQAYSDLVANIGKLDLINKEGYLVITAPKNPTLKWEMNYTTNAALEFGFWKRRLTGSLEYYNKKAVDLLGSKEVSQVTGFNTVQVNWASMRNSGVEFSLSSINVDSKSFRWSTNINFGYNKNEVLEVYSVPGVADLTNAQRSNYSAAAVVGKPINGLWSYRYAGLNKDGRAAFYTQKDGQKVLYGMKSVDGLTYSGTTMPIAQGGFTNTFTYKKFTLSGLFIGSFGNVIRLRNISLGNVGYPEATQNMSKEWVDRWRQPGDELKTDIPTLEKDPFDLAISGATPYNGTMYDNSDLRTVKGDFVRLQNLSLSYDLFSPKLRANGIQNIRFMLQGNNLYTWKNSRLKGQDPESTGSLMKYDRTNNANVSFGNTYLPVPRAYSLTLSVQF
ncbi:MAG: SusC/RagA family TonB-linked outer membrane protein [Candidatus Pedobacter colombiensis]|uniref:SusC/RagA family TonB-linked outer membrane protein n=1 Tax=Candidatus Pedobacter colombiensis TaxID=3121371 RepID=A0AAJ6B7R2_9SPHI|nr:SusC/RagA family TonB-linked outer membrane protein [Pedobacter sp.]WEK20565.1 MAG: SusC/RagA family TonB-linked outer membrane protein [Pedobacter sp.]